MNKPNTAADLLDGVLRKDFAPETLKAITLMQLYDLCMAEKKHLIFNDGFRREAVPVEALAKIFNQPEQGE